MDPDLALVMDLADAFTTAVFTPDTAAIFGLPALGLGADGVWLAVPAAELLSLFVTLFLLKKNRARYGF